MLSLLLLLLAPTATAFVGGRGHAALAATTRARPQAAPPLQMARGATADLLNSKRTTVDSLASLAPGMSEIARLRFALAFPTQAEASAALKETMVWREGPGKYIVDAAAAAVATATAGGGWDNDVVRDAAPYAARINKYISPKNTLTLSTDSGDLVYCIRASAIEDKAMMDALKVEEVTDFLLYVKEVHSLVANARSERTGQLCEVVFANDITGVRAPPNKKFAEALTASSKVYETLYPALGGATMIMNLPLVLQAFVGFFKPLFPKSLQARLKFVRAPTLAKLPVLTPLSTEPETRKKFLAEVNDLLKK
jgi:hypothetical protein